MSQLGRADNSELVAGVRADIQNKSGREGGREGAAKTDPAATALTSSLGNGFFSKSTMPLPKTRMGNNDCWSA